MRAITLILMSLVLAMAMQAKEASQMLKQGNAYYASQQFSKAIDAYKEVIRQGRESSALYFNTGNAYFRTNQLPHAVLYYEKALLLDPNDKEIQENLEMARKLTGDEIEAVPEFFLTRWRKAVMNSLSADTWGVISVSSFLLLLLAVGFFVAGQAPSVKRSAFFGGLMMLLALGISFSMGYAQKQRVQAHNSAIVFSPSVTVRSAPNPSATSLFVLHEGTKARIQEKSDGWYEIRIANGEVGWLKKEDIRRI